MLFRSSRNIFAGQYHSAFKGRGMAFSEVREYQFGDDIRDIDWNVTARYIRPYVKVFRGRTRIDRDAIDRCVRQQGLRNSKSDEERGYHGNCCYTGFFGNSKQR